MIQYYKNDFIMDSARMLGKLLSKPELEGIKDIMRDGDDFSLFKHLIDVGVIRPCDWKHCDEADLFLFVDERMSVIAFKGLSPLNITPSSATELYDEIHRTGKRNFANFLLKFYNRILASTGLKLMAINRQDDCYYLVLVQASEASKLKRIKSNFWIFYDLK